MSSLTRGRFAAAACLAALAIAGCAEEQPPEHAVLDHTRSASSGSPQLCARNLSVYARARYGGVGTAGGSMRVDVFDETTRANPTFPVKVVFDIPSGDESSPRKTKEALAEDLDRLDEDVTAMLVDVGEPFGGTNVPTMLAAVGDAVRAVEGDRIWFCSDMLDNRLRPRPITSARAKALVDSLARDDELPDLGGISIVVDTVTAQGRGDLDSGDLGGLRAFTELLVERSGGTLVAYGPGAGVGGD